MSALATLEGGPDLPQEGHVIWMRRRRILFFASLEGSPGVVRLHHENEQSECNERQDERSSGVRALNSAQTIQGINRRRTLER